MICRFCQNELINEFVDLGYSPPSNSFLSYKQLNSPETFYPLKIMVCEKCFLVQLDEFAKHDDIFNEEYVYFSSYSTTWLEHVSNYVDMMHQRFKFNDKSLIIEIASNDGYLLQFFKKKNIPVLGIEPTLNTANVAKEKGIDTIVDFFGEALSSKLLSEGIQADLLLGNNVLAHVPNIVDFVKGLKNSLKINGVITFEFPHLLQLIDKNQFDTIYHEHFSYLSLYTVKQIFNKYGLEIFDVEELDTHGGSIRIFGKHIEDTSKEISDNVNSLLLKETSFGISNINTYLSFQKKSEKVKNSLIRLLIELESKGKKVAAYGAAAKGNTLLNYAGIRKDLIHFISDASPHKQNKFTPGMHIPVFSEEKLKHEKPDYIVIMPWNLKKEIMSQLNYIRDWGGKFIIAVPELSIQ
jgi:2-polyprenyl-3-methyl-5-hydroxy-6-metoxy-1,4-benzoquinol methylase